MEADYDAVIKSVDWAAVKAAELRKVSIHECAHQAVAWHFGVPSRVTITPNPNAAAEQLFFVGQCQLLTDLSEPKTRIVCLAGTVAEQVDRDRGVEALEMRDLIGAAIELSETDAAGAGDWDLPDLKECVALVKRLWREIELAASHQIEIENAVIEAEASSTMNIAARRAE